METIHHTDVVVLGGGSAGVAAAVAAARKGQHTLSSRGMQQPELLARGLRVVDPGPEFRVQ